VTETKHPAWARHLDAIAEELQRLTIACNVKLRDPGVIDRILKNDESVCGTANPIGFRKLRSLLMATYSSVNKAVDRIGPEELKTITDGIVERMDKLRAGGGSTPAQPGKKP
jgi:hypothetical protein